MDFNRAEYNPYSELTDKAVACDSCKNYIYSPMNRLPISCEEQKLLNMEREWQKQIMMVTVPITEDGERLEEASEHKKNKKIAQDEVSGVFNPRIMLNPVTPSETKMAASSLYVKLMELFECFTDMGKRNKAVSDALVLKEAEDKKKEIAQDEVCSVLNLTIMFKHPILPKNPSKNLMAASSSDNANTVDNETASLYEIMDLLLEADARIQYVLVNNDVGNPEEVVGDARPNQIDELVSQQELRDAVSENTEELFGSQLSDLGIELAWNFRAISSESYCTDEALLGDGYSISEPLGHTHSVEEDQEQSVKDVSGSATATTTSQPQTPNAMSRKQEWMNMQASALSSPSPGVRNSILSSNEAGWSSNPPSGEAAVSQIMCRQDEINFLVNMQREHQKKMADFRKKKKKIAQDEVSSVLNPPVMLNTITPSEVLIAAYSSENTNTVQSKAASLSDKLIEEDARNQHVFVNSDVGNPEVDVIDVDDARSTESDDLGFQWGPPIILNPIAPSEILMVASSEIAKTVKSKATSLTDILDILDEQDARNQHVVFNSDVGDARSTQIDDLGPQRHPPIMLGPIIPSEILMAASSSENTNTVQSKAASFPDILDIDARNLLFNSNVRNPEVKDKIVGGARSTQIDEFQQDPSIMVNPMTPYLQRALMYQAFADMGNRHKAISDALVGGEAEHKKKEIALSGSPNLATLFEYPTHLVNPFEILMAASSSKNTNTVDSDTASLYETMDLLIEEDARNQDVLVNSDIGNPEVEVKVVGDARASQIGELGSHRALRNAVSENTEELFCSQASDLGIKMARNFCAISSESYITEEARLGDGYSISEPVGQFTEEDQEQSGKDLSGSATAMSATTTSQLPTPNAKSRKQDWMNMQASAPSSPSPVVRNSIVFSNEAGGSSSSPSGEASVSEIMGRQDEINHLTNMERELQKQKTMIVLVRMTGEGERIEEAELKKKNKIVQENTNTVDGKTALSLYVQLMELLEGKPKLLEGDASIQDVGNSGVEVKVVGKQGLLNLMNLEC